MRYRTFGIAAALAAGPTGMPGTGHAYAPHKGAEPPVVAAGHAPRAYRDIAWHAPARAGLSGWRVMWDRDTDVPLRAWGPALPAPRASADPVAAEAIARELLAAHLHVLARGASPSDFVLAANTIDRDGRVRTVAFAQQAHGLPVVGGAIGFAFVGDRMVMMSSTALPHVTVRLPGGPVPAPTLAHAATSWLAQEIANGGSTTSSWRPTPRAARSSSSSSWRAIAAWRWVGGRSTTSAS
jgi:hypothetical protein